MGTMKETLRTLLVVLIIAPSFIGVAPTQSLLIIYTFLLACLGAACIARFITDVVIKEHNLD